MDSKRYERIGELFSVACELDGAERDAYLADACGDDAALRAEVEDLLARDSRPDHRLATSAEQRGDLIRDALLDAETTEHEAPPSRIGPYKLLEKIGEGGMGEVYAADQLQPVQRRVALKLIKRGMDSAQVVARFEAERQALARMSHPNVAQVYDGGTTDDGRPYFVMEYVAGEPITDSSDRRKLTTQQRVELFLGVCEGVQHAHQKGIIHRDLKPSNLMVTSEAGRTVPKIIDFGVARAVTGRLVERTLHTMMGQVVGTLDYMSPEQADPTGVDVDTRSDIYSLGVVLYQLVSGLLPFDFTTSTDVPLSEVQRAIREQEPPTPSTRLGRQTVTATSIAARHGTDGHSLVRQLHGDLDWICLKALEKDPARRYASAAEFADDLRRYLAYEPVLAGRPGLLYRARKFVRRNRVGVTAGVLVVAGLVAGAAGIVSGRIEAQTNAVRADAERASVLRQSASVSLLELQNLLGEADTLWPVSLAMVPACDAWLERAEALVARLEPAADGSHPGFRRQLVDLRATALPLTESERQADREAHPRSTELQQLHSKIAEAREQLAAARQALGAALTTDQEALLAKAQAEIDAAVLERDALDAALDERRTFTYPHAEDTIWHADLVTLVEGLQALSDPEVGLMFGRTATEPSGWSVRRRRDEAAPLTERTLTGAEATERWAAAIASIADREACPAYDGLRIAPQLGLLPLGIDPDSGLWLFTHVLSGAPAERDPVTGRIVPTDEMGIVLVLLPGGTFLLGSQNRDPSGDNYDPNTKGYGFIAGVEGPVTQDVVNPFFLSKFELTSAQWARCRWQEPAIGLFPITDVPARRAESAMSRVGLTFPTEEQWEYAARGGTGTPWWTGPDVESLEGAGNFYDQSISMNPRTRGLMHLYAGIPVDWDDGFTGPAPVGSFEPNAFGLYDVHGNAAEFCFVEWFDHREPRHERLPNRIHARGGSFEHGAITARVSCRTLGQDMEASFPAAGLRPARALEP